MQVGSAAVEALYEDLVISRNSVELRFNRVEGRRLEESLRLDCVSYKYPNSKQSGIRDVSLTIRAGEKIGIVGSTGAGKTTLADIILGLLKPTNGKLVVDGVDIDADQLSAWMQCVGYVPQDIFLTDASVAENIALGLLPDDIDYERIFKAAKIAGIDHFVAEELTDGYEAQIGERGVRLSGGQRQRIGIARALYRDADLVVFDEATSALDNLTEAEVMEAIDSLPGDKTIILIAHRLSTVKRCDRIVVLDQGLVVGCGSWDHLMSSNAAFQRIARMGEAA